MAVRITTLEFVTTRDVGGGAVALDFRPTRPLGFRAGQHGLWVLPHGVMSPFTVASAPEEDLVALATGLASGSRTKRALAALQPGARVRLVGPLSSFTLDPSAPAVAMLAQGIGVTPFRSMLVHAALAGATAPTTLVHVAPPAGHAYRADTEATATRAHYPVSREEFGAAVAAAVGDLPPGAPVMVSGSRRFVADTTAALDGLGVDRSRVRRDTFYGWSGRLPATRPVA